MRTIRRGALAPRLIGPVMSLALRRGPLAIPDIAEAKP